MCEVEVWGKLIDVYMHMEMSWMTGQWAGRLQKVQKDLKDVREEWAKEMVWESCARKQKFNAY